MVLIAGCVGIGVLLFAVAQRGKGSVRGIYTNAAVR